MKVRGSGIRLTGLARGGRRSSAAGAGSYDPGDEALFAPLRRLRRWCRAYLALDGLVWLAVSLILASLAQLLIDWRFRLAIDQRAVLNAVITLYWLWVIYRSIALRVLSPLTDEALAMLIDRAHPQLHDHYATAVQFARADFGFRGAALGSERRTPNSELSPEVRTPNAGPSDGASPELVRIVLAEGRRIAAGLPVLDILNHRRALRRGFELLALLGLIAAACWRIPQPIQTWFARNWLLADRPWPQSTHITPTGFDENRRRRMPRGEELEVQAQIEVSGGDAPKTATLWWWTPSGRKGRETMTRIGQRRLTVSLGQLPEDVHFRITGGDERTDEYVVEAIERPRVVYTTARITPPAYTGLEAVVVEQQTAVDVLRGATLEIEAKLNKPVRQADFVGAAGPAAPCELTTARDGQPAVRVRWDEPQSGAYHFELVDADNWSGRNPVIYTIKVVPDRPPAVQMRLPGAGELVTPAAELRIDLNVEDTYGIGTVSLLAQRNDLPAQAAPIQGFRPGMPRFQAAVHVGVLAAGAQPGDRLRLWAQAADLDPSGPNEARATPVELRVVSVDDFLAEMARRELELRQEFERLISAQAGLEDELERILAELPEGGAPPAAPSQRLLSVARRQAGHAARCLTLAQHFEQVLVEMQTSKVARAADEQRLIRRVVEPLSALGREAMPAAAEVVSELRREASAERRRACASAQADLLLRMRAILANMLEWEGYREAVDLLSKIIAAQGDIRAQTLRELERQLQEILGLEEEPERSGPEAPGAPPEPPSPAPGEPKRMPLRANPETGRPQKP